MRNWSLPLCLLSLTFLATPSLAGPKGPPARVSPVKPNAPDTSAAKQARASKLLLRAIEEEEVELAQIALTQGADPNSRNQAGIPALSLIASKYFTKDRELMEARKEETREENAFLIKEMIRRGARVNAVDPKGRTALMHAAISLQSSIAEELIKAGADVNARTKLGVTALMVAAVSHDSLTVDVLLDAGADPNMSDKDNFTALLYSFLRPLPRFPVGMIVADAHDEYRTALLTMQETVAGDDIMYSLIQHGADPTATSKDGMSTLHLALGISSPKLIRFLLSKGAKIEQAMPNGYTPLIVATLLGRGDNVRVLLAAGANPNIASTEGDTPLHMAAARARYAIAEMLLAKGADRTAKSKDGQTPLDYAVSEKHTALVHLLEEK